MNKYFSFIVMTILIYGSFISCDKTTEPIDDDNGLFVPQSNMTQSQIIELLENAIKNTISSDEISYTEKDSSSMYRNPPYGQLGEPSTIDHLYSLNKQAQKLLEVCNYLNDGVTEFRYVDDFNVYNGYTNLQLDDKFYRAKLDDVYWSHQDFNITDFELNCDKYTWIIKEKCFIGKFEATLPATSGYPDVNETIEIILTKDLRLNRMYSNLQIGDLYRERGFSFTYTAMPMMPQGYSISDFTPIPQYEVKIIWENGSENSFYTYYEEQLFHTSMVDLYYHYPGKFLRLFYDANYTNLFEATEIITENVTLYAKWVEL